MTAAANSLVFGVARLFRDATFRARLKTAGHEGEVLVPVTGGSSVADLLAWVDDRPGRVLLAIADDRRPHGLRLVWWQDAEPGTEEDEA
jgi:hypothetical protein